MPLADTIGSATVALPNYSPSALVVEQLVGEIECPCDYSDRKWGFSHSAAQWVGFVKPCATCHTSGQRLFCEGCWAVFSQDDNCFTCECGEVTAPARHAFSRLDRI